MSVCVSVSVCNCVSALPCSCVCVCEHISLSACVSAHLLRPLLPRLEPPTCRVVPLPAWPLPPVEMTGFPTAPSYLLPARSPDALCVLDLAATLAASTLKSRPRGPFAQGQGNGVRIGPPRNLTRPLPPGVPLPAPPHPGGGGGPRKGPPLHRCYGPGAAGTAVGARQRPPAGPQNPKKCGPGSQARTGEGGLGPGPAPGRSLPRGARAPWLCRVQ